MGIVSLADILLEECDLRHDPDLVVGLGQEVQTDAGQPDPEGLISGVLIASSDHGAVLAGFPRRSPIFPCVVCVYDDHVFVHASRWACHAKTCTGRKGAKREREEPKRGPRERCFVVFRHSAVPAAEPQPIISGAGDWTRITSVLSRT